MQPSRVQEQSYGLRPGIVPEQLVESSSVLGPGQPAFIISPWFASRALGWPRRLDSNQEDAGVEVGAETWPGTIIAFAGPPGTVVFWRLFLETAVVDSTDSRP